MPTNNDDKCNPASGMADFGRTFERTRFHAATISVEARSSKRNAIVPAVAADKPIAGSISDTRMSPQRSREIEDLRVATVPYSDVLKDTSLISLNSHRVQSFTEKALFGLPGHIVESCDPYTEADPIAVLAQLLCMYGNLVGPSPRVYLGDNYHPARINILLVGDTALGRKGTSVSVVRRLLANAYPDFNSRVASGVSTGEGIAQNLTRREHDKRLIVVEEEFASVLTKMKREGNTLSTCIREFFDRGSFEVITRNDPLRVENCHISMIGHITPDEMHRKLDNIDMLNGFGNRFLWLNSEQSKILSRNPKRPEELTAKLCISLKRSIDFGKTRKEVLLSDSALNMWDWLYTQRLNQKREGKLGALFARGPVFIMRLALIYALFDCSDTIEPKHLTAAYSLWQYSEACLKQLFENDLLSPVATKVIVTCPRVGNQYLS